MGGGPERPRRRWCHVGTPPRAPAWVTLENICGCSSRRRRTAQAASRTPTKRATLAARSCLAWSRPPTSGGVPLARRRTDGLSGALRRPWQVDHDMFGVRMLTFVASFKMRRLIKLAASRVRLRMLAAYSSDRSSAAVYVGPNWTQNIDKWIVFIGEEIRCAAWENRVLLSSGAPRHGSFRRERRGCLTAQVRKMRPPRLASSCVHHGRTLPTPASSCMQHCCADIRLFVDQFFI